MRRSGLTRAGVLALALLTSAGCAGEAADGVATESALARSAKIDDSSFARPLTKALVRGTHTLDSASFESKWQASLADGPLMFLRAYPAAFHLDLAQVPIERVPGSAGLCVGDAHPDNFGYLHVDGVRGRSSIYAFNDLDDSGPCLLALDALRYFVAFRLYFDDDPKLKESLDRYVDEAFGEETASPTEAAWRKAKDDAPDWGAVADEMLEKYVRGDAFRSLPPEELLPVNATSKTAVRSALARAPGAAGVTVLDVAERPRVGGGSGGLTRYWALVTLAGGARTILELKETARPGVDFGRGSAPLSAAERLPVLKRALWNGSSDTDYFTVAIGRSTFLVRDRARKESADVSGKLRDAQAAYLGALHRHGWGTLKKSDAREWLDDSSKVVAKRWKAFYRAEGGTR